MHSSGQVVYVDTNYYREGSNAVYSHDALATALLSGDQQITYTQQFTQQQYSADQMMQNPGQMGPNVNGSYWSVNSGLGGVGGVGQVLGNSPIHDAMLVLAEY